MKEHGIPSQARASWGRSHRSSRRSDDLKGGLGKPVVGRRVTGEPLEPDAATRNAERPKGEKRQLASRLPGNSYGRFARRAEEKGPRAAPRQPPILLSTSVQKSGSKQSCMDGKEKERAAPSWTLFLERMSQVASTTLGASIEVVLQTDLGSLFAQTISCSVLHLLVPNGQVFLLPPASIKSV